MLDLDQLRKAVAAGKRRFDLIRKKYSGLGSLAFVELQFGELLTTSKLLSALSADGIAVPAAQSELESLNMLLADRHLHSRFSRLRLDQRTEDLMQRASTLSPEDCTKLNRRLLEAAYPEHCPQKAAMSAYLVLSMPGGQAEIDSSPKQILKKLPDTVVGDGVKTNALALMSHLEMLEFQAVKGPEMERFTDQLSQLLPRLKYEGHCQVEIRFTDLNHDLIWKLQQDDLVDRSLTPQTKASIRIVLGTISRLAGG